MPKPLRVVIDDRCLRRTLTGVGNYVAQLLQHINPESQPDVRVDPFVFTHLSRKGWSPPTERAVGPSTDVAPAISRGPGTMPGAMPTASGGPGAMPTASGGHAATAGTKSAGTRIRSRTPHDVAGGRKPWWIRRAIQIAYGQTFRWKTRGRYDIYHEPNHVPVRSKLPTVTTIHDLSVIVHPEWHPADRVKWYESAFEAGLRQSRRFIAASEFTKREMVARLNIDPDKIDVTYQGPRDDFTPQSSTTIANVRQAMDLPEHFFLYVGTLEPRKNVEGLLDAFARLPADLRHEHPLLIAGAWGWKAEQLRTKIDAHKVAGEVRLLGYMHDRQLAALYSACTALVWPTFYEGFGLPPLEAMACGAPVIVSDVASLPEVVGNAGVKLPPDETQAWTEALERAANERSGADESAAERRRQSSLEQAALFSWQRCTSETIESYRRAIA